MRYEEILALFAIVFINGRALFRDSTWSRFVLGYLVYYPLLIFIYSTQTINLQVFLIGILAPPFTGFMRLILKEYLQKSHARCPNCGQRNTGEIINEQNLGSFERPILTNMSYSQESARYAKVRTDMRCTYCGEEWSITIRNRI
jgi:DNA-directed RNA polymerase subunit RPC12/RpoP